ncbi:hypothetical protein EUTSA_v10015236mg [Eutrema salsugineum]|uniref:Uncharacterized protein n=2 Tax=Eutrema salsugineum TaxID=72664 RepID=V4LGL8_EUTSA|nr:hypothetical protein EUTSA_v10015236mg [Eutrema salsugineum]
MESQDSECDDDIKGEEHKISVASVKQDEEQEEVEDVKEIIQDDPSICCRSDRSNNSISSFTFPILHNEDGSVKTPTMESRRNFFDKRLELSHQPRSQPQFYFIPSTHTPNHLPPQRKSSFSKQASETQSQKAFRNRWFSCFFGPF